MSIKKSKKIKDFDLFNAKKLKTGGNVIRPTNPFTGFKKKDIHQSIGRYFENTAREFPENTAVKTRTGELTYCQLNRQANRAARYICQHRGQKTEGAALLFEHDTDMIIGIMAALKAGRFYIPLDPNYPPDRLIYMLNDSNAEILLTNQKNSEFAGELKRKTADSIPIVNIDTLPPGLSVDNPDLDISPLHPAYILYTSGSTGRPKGVIQQHRNVLHFIRVYTNNLHIHENDRLTLFSSYSFDAAVMDIFGALLNGAALYPFNVMEEENFHYLPQWLSQERITIYHSIPTLYRYFMEIFNHREIPAFPALRFIVLGGEAVYKRDVENFQEHFTADCLFINGLGPTESTVTLQYFIDKNTTDIRESVPVGSAVGETHVFLVDDNNREAKVFQPGEIIYKSNYLAAGYANMPERTGEVFVTDPLTHKGRVFRTGDLGRRLEDGNIEFLGRKDTQLKIRGYRIEPGEIENLLLNHPGVKEAIILAGTAENEDKYLCAYIVPNRELPVGELRRYLSKDLPDYMIPSYFVLLEKIPLTPGGKIDRRALPEPLTNIEQTAKKHHQPPRDEVEKKLAEIWSEVLELDAANMSSLPVSASISIDDDFFQLGGHSLRAVIVTNRIHKAFHVNIPLAQLFRTPTIREIASLIENKQKPGIVQSQSHKKFASVEPVEKKDYYALSPQKKRLYILHRLEPGNTAYNITQAIPLKGTINKNKLEETFKKLIARHESLRTSFTMLNDEPVQRIHDEGEFEIEYYVLATKDTESTEDIKEGNQEADNRKLKTKEILQDKKLPTANRQLATGFFRPFDLSRAPLLRVGTAAMENNRHTLLVDMHHIIADGTSRDILKKEFTALYAGEELPPLRLHYKDFSGWQNSEEQKTRISRQESYWIQRFSHELPELQLPTDYPRPLIQSFEGRTLNFFLGEKETRTLKEMAKETGTTLYMILLAVYTLLLAKLSGQEDIIVGTPTAARRHADLERIIGMFANTLVLRNYPAAEKTFKAFLNELKERTLEAFENQEYQFEDLVEKISPPRDTGRNPIFDVMFNLLIPSGYTGDLPGTDRQNTDEYRHREGTSKFDLNLTALDMEKQLFFNLEYCSRLFKPGTIERIIGYFKNIISLLSADKNPGLSTIEIITPEEKEEILNLSMGIQEEFAARQTIHQWFEIQAGKTPDSITVNGVHQLPGFKGTKPQGHITYRELNRKSDQLAFWLREKGVLADNIVGIMVERSIEMIIGILGIMKAGGAYLPIDPEYPQERIDYMLKDSGAKVLLTNLSEGHHFHQSSFINHHSSTLAYVIYTSGSTGRPKGVMLEHRNLVNLMHFQFRHTTIDCTKILQFASISFDISFLEIFSALLSGGILYVIDKETRTDIPGLFEFIGKNEIKTVFLPMSFLKMIFQEKEYIHRIPGSIDHIQTAGEQVIIDNHFREYLKKAKVFLHNHYGPTEAHVVTALTMNPREDLPALPSIGRPVLNTVIYLLDKNQHPVPVGVPGELYIGGSQVGRGYLNNPELTAEKFFSVSSRSYRSYWTYTPKKIYKTGDLAKWRSDGNIEFLGRIDFQVKIRGFRVELAEIETRLLNHDAVKEAVVTAGEEQNKNKYLCAYIVSKTGISFTRLQEYLAKHLPDYMIPSYVVFLETIPLTPSGKIDRKKLPAPGMKTFEEYTPPGNPLEKKLAEIWSKTLDVPQEKIGIHHNFFNLGGHSLKAIQMAARLEREGFNISMNQIFIYPTIAQLTKQIHQAAKEEKKEPAAPGNVHLPVEPKKIDIKQDQMKKHLKEVFRSINRQAREFKRKIMENPVEKKYLISYNQKLHLGVGTHNLELVIPFETSPDRKRLNRAVLNVIREQGLLKSVLINEKGKLMWQQYAAPRDISIPYLDLSHYEPRSQQTIISRIALEKSSRKFSTHSLLYRIVVVKDLLTMYLKKYFKPGSLAYKFIIKLGSFTKYLRKNCRGNSLLYRLLLVRKNLPEHLLFIRLDHIIGDNTTLDLIRTGILQYYNTPGEINREEARPYQEYVDQVNLGPRGITPDRLQDFLAVDEYQHYSALVSSFIDQQNTGNAYSFNYKYPFNPRGYLNEEKAWDIAFILVHLLCKALFNLPKIPSKLLYYGRNYGGSTYFNTVGEFWDLIPMLIEVDEEEPLKMVQRANELVKLASAYNINFVSMFLNEELYRPWKRVIDLVAPARLTPPESMILIDFLGKSFNRNPENQSPQSAPISQKEKRKLNKERYLNTRNQGGFLVYVSYDWEALSIDVLSIIEINAKKLKKTLDQQARHVLPRIIP